MFNQKAFIERAIASALDQDLPALEIIVVDNASSDGTWERVQKYAPRGVKLHRNSRNIGLFGNFNRCLELARAPYVRLLGGDDALAPRCLGRELALMERHPEVAMLSTRGEFVDSVGRSMGRFAGELALGIYDGRRFAAEWLDYYVHYRRNPLNYPSGVLLRRTAVDSGVRFNERLKTAGDIDFFMSVLQHGNLAVDGALGCFVTRHEGQAHVQPNLDGTAMRELLALLERVCERGGAAPAKRRLLDQFAGMCLAVAIQRRAQGYTDSARVHLALARATASGWGAALAGLSRLAGCRLAGALLGRHAPHLPKPLHAL